MPEILILKERPRGRQAGKNMQGCRKACGMRSPHNDFIHRKGTIRFHERSIWFLFGIGVKSLRGVKCFLPSREESSGSGCRKGHAPWKCLLAVMRRLWGIRLVRRR